MYRKGVRERLLRIRATVIPTQALPVFLISSLINLIESPLDVHPFNYFKLL